jgi:four helix bundle protein
MECLFDHEKLKAYQQAIQFVAWVTPLIDQLEKSKSVRDQLDRASTSVSLNIAEGNAKFSMKDRCRYLDTADSSAVECAAALDVLVAQKRLKPEQIREGKLILQQIVVMGLRNNAQSRIREELVPYGVPFQE